jgi:phosphatidylserine/phosphatidylglycerophosphate/cardiolipin synthase-like enzyme
VAAYDADWNRDKFTPQSSALVWSPVNSRAKLTGLVGSAQKTLLVYAELAQDDPIIDAMIQAQKRGVKVRFLISPSKQTDGEDANKVDLDKLQKGGVKVRYISSPYQHSKAFVADDTLAYIGSINLSTGSMEFNRELGILFSDKTAIRLLDEIFEKDWNKATDR